MPETKRRDSSAEREIVGTQDRFRLIRAGVGGAPGVVIHGLREGVVGLEGQAPAGAFDDGNVE